MFLYSDEHTLKLSSLQMNESLILAVPLPDCFSHVCLKDLMTWESDQIYVKSIYVKLFP